MALALRVGPALHPGASPRALVSFDPATGHSPIGASAFRHLDRPDTAPFGTAPSASALGLPRPGLVGSPALELRMPSGVRVELGVESGCLFAGGRVPARCPGIAHHAAAPRPPQIDVGQPRPSTPHGGASTRRRFCGHRSRRAAVGSPVLAIARGARDGRSGADTLACLRAKPAGCAPDLPLRLLARTRGSGWLLWPAPFSSAEPHSRLGS